MTNGILSKESAVGLIMVKGISTGMYTSTSIAYKFTGNIGRYLTSDSSIYLSHDGGFTWEEVLVMINIKIIFMSMHFLVISKYNFLFSIFGQWICNYHQYKPCNP